MLEGITHKSFESIIGETVDLQAGEVKFQAEVEAVSMLLQSPGQERQPFSVLLQAHNASNHGQNTYRLSHTGLGELDLFLVPIGMGKDGIRYEVVFN